MPNAAAPPDIPLGNLTPFWRWHVVGWLSYGIAMFIAAAQELPIEQALVNKSVNVGLGFMLSLGLRAFYLELTRREMSLARVIPWMIAGCILAGALWSVMANAFFWHFTKGSFVGMGVDRLFAWTLVHTIVLGAWCAIYLGAQQVDELQKAAAVAQALKASGAPPLVVRADGELVRLPQEHIHSIEAARNYSCIVSDAGTHVVRQPLSALGARLDPQAFLRVHRSAIVSIAKLKSLRALPSQDAIAILLDGREIRVSRSFRARVEQALNTRL